MSKIKSFIERHRQKLLSINQLKTFVEKWLGNNDKPFEITLKSGIANIERKFKFMCWGHFYSYLEKVINSGKYVDYDYTKTLHYNASNLKSQNELFDYEYDNKKQNNMEKHNLIKIANNPITRYFNTQSQEKIEK